MKPPPCLNCKPLRARLEESETGRERDREQFRKGTAAWNAKISAAEEDRDYWKRLRVALMGVLKDTQKRHLAVLGEREEAEAGEATLDRVCRLLEKRFCGAVKDAVELEIKNSDLREKCASVEKRAAQTEAAARELLGAKTAKATGAGFKKLRDALMPKE